MCGIYGIVRFNDSQFNTKLLRVILKRLAIESRQRGGDATGYAFTGKDGVNIFKHNTHAENFTKLANYKQTVRENLPGTGTNGYPYSIIGHTRAKTLGTPMNPDNNHPIRTGSIVGVHNGMISNHTEVFKWLTKTSENEVRRIAQVDSEAIFALIDYMSKVLKWPAKYSDQNVIGHVGDPTSRAITRAAGKLTGSFACAAVDADSPQYTWLFRGYGDMAINYYRDEGLLVFASVERYIDKAVKIYGMSEPDTLALDPHSAMCINAEKGVYNIFKIDEPKYGRGYSSCMY